MILVYHLWYVVLGREACCVKSSATRRARMPLGQNEVLSALWVPRAAPLAMFVSYTSTSVALSGKMKLQGGGYGECLHTIEIGCFVILLAFLLQVNSFVGRDGRWCGT